MSDRYVRQQSILGTDGQETLSRKKVLILGCGGLGGYLLEYMVRLGVGCITVVDPDVFDPSNLNRQLLSSDADLGRSKAVVAAERAKQINPTVEIRPLQASFCPENADDLVRGQDLVLDGLDNISARLVMEDACARHGVPIVHGAISGWMAQVTTVLPGSGVLHRLYGGAQGNPAPASLAFTPACCASIQAAEALKLLLGHEPTLKNKLLLLDLQTMTQKTLPL